MVPDGVTLADLPAHELRVCRRVLADQEEGRLDALRLQRVKHFSRRFGKRTIVEGQNDFVIFEL